MKLFSHSKLPLSSSSFVDSKIILELVQDCVRFVYTHLKRDLGSDDEDEDGEDKERMSKRKVSKRE